MKYYSCPSCKKQYPLKTIFLLNGNSKLQCINCKRYSKPTSLGKMYFVGGFLSFYVSGLYFMYLNKSFVEIMIYASLLSIGFYFLAVIYCYFTVKFE